MAWRMPCGLQSCAARAVVIPLVSETDLRIRRHLANVPAELLIARATAELLLRENEDDDDEAQDKDSCTSGCDDDDAEAPYTCSAPGSDNPTQMDAMDHVILQVKTVVEEVRQWWTTVPGNNAGPRLFLELALEAHTEVHPQHDQDFPRHLTRLLLRLVLLQEVFIDRDYGDKDRRCVIPYAWERWTASLVAQLAPFLQLVHLKVYGGMYPSILAAVLRGASRHLLSSHLTYQHHRRHPAGYRKARKPLNPSTPAALPAGPRGRPHYHHGGGHVTRSEFHVATLSNFLQLCPNLIHLGVRVWSKNMVEAELDDQENLTMSNCSLLQEFSLHEEGPGDADETAAEVSHTQRWTALLRGVVAAAPHLSCLSLSVCRGLASILDTLACNVHVLHFHVKDGYEWQPSPEQVCQLVCRLPHLHHLYLEEVSGQLFWRLVRHYQYTDLRLHWGNLHGWPRT
ncbi:hypothetical protein GWK47_024883 [Chionoecetes opilio]|uniref:Uncharacterized protein n=1 Tax=Chionoecetes opilio TaxID=41210 RepID=A0A8J5CJ15_CHIOP|nr:hypothetical protein GWK47_024883 [Chionoecetes opilio]